MTWQRQMRRITGFTLVELLVVVVMMSVLVAVAISVLNAPLDDARIGVAQHSLRTLQTQIAIRTASSGQVPDTIDATWFSGRAIPRNPFNNGEIPDIHIFEGDRLHPSYKYADRYGAYWYNKSNGKVRCRIPRLGSSSAELELYNTVNGSNLTSMSQVK